MKFDIVQHFRWVVARDRWWSGRDSDYVLGTSDHTAKAKGGVTVAGLIQKDGSVRWGISYCHEKDNFEKKKGREEAIARAKYIPVIVTANLDYPVAKAFARILATVRHDRLPTLNLNKYLEILTDDPNFTFHTKGGYLREFYFKD